MMLVREHEEAQRLLKNPLGRWQTGLTSRLPDIIVASDANLTRGQLQPQPVMEFRHM
jgi:hypothetical protein